MVVDVGVFFRVRVSVRVSGEMDGAYAGDFLSACGACTGETDAHACLQLVWRSIIGGMARVF